MSKKPSAYSISKFEGDDRFSWALFKNGRPIMTGMSRTEASHRMAEHRRVESQTRPEGNKSK